MSCWCVSFVLGIGQHVCTTSIMCACWIMQAEDWIACESTVAKETCFLVSLLCVRNASCGSLKVVIFAINYLFFWLCQRFLVLEIHEKGQAICPCQCLGFTQAAWTIHLFLETRILNHRGFFFDQLDGTLCTLTTFLSTFSQSNVS